MMTHMKSRNMWPRVLITKIIKQFMSDASYFINGRLHVSFPTGPSSGLLMNQVINAALMT
jgi:hypothetical protein